MLHPPISTTLGSESKRELEAGLQYNGLCVNTKTKKFLFFRAYKKEIWVPSANNMKESMFAHVFAEDNVELRKKIVKENNKREVSYVLPWKFDCNVDSPTVRMSIPYIAECLMPQLRKQVKLESEEVAAKQAAVEPVVTENGENDELLEKMSKQAEAIDRTEATVSQTQAKKLEVATKLGGDKKATKKKRPVSATPSKRPAVKQEEKQSGEQSVSESTKSAKSSAKPPSKPVAKVQSKPVAKASSKPVAKESVAVKKRQREADQEDVVASKRTRAETIEYQAFDSTDADMLNNRATLSAWIAYTRDCEANNRFPKVPADMFENKTIGEMVDNPKGRFIPACIVRWIKTYLLNDTDSVTIPPLDEFPPTE